MSRVRDRTLALYDQSFYHLTRPTADMLRSQTYAVSLIALIIDQNPVNGQDVTRVQQNILDNRTHGIHTPLTGEQFVIVRDQILTAFILMRVAMRQAFPQPEQDYKEEPAWLLQSFEAISRPSTPFYLVPAGLGMINDRKWELQYWFRTKPAAERPTSVSQIVCLTEHAVRNILHHMSPMIAWKHCWDGGDALEFEAIARHSVAVSNSTLLSLTNAELVEAIKLSPSFIGWATRVVHNVWVHNPTFPSVLAEVYYGPGNGSMRPDGMAGHKRS